MNEITVLRDFGPDALAATAADLATVRAHLMADIGTATASRRSTIRLPRRVVVRLGILAAAAAMVGGVFVVSGTSDHAPPVVAAPAPTTPSAAPRSST